MYDYDLSFSITTNKVLAMVIKKQVMNGFSFYILRVMNLMADANSIVYRDYLIENVLQ